MVSKERAEHHAQLIKRKRSLERELQKINLQIYCSQEQIVDRIPDIYDDGLGGSKLELPTLRTENGLLYLQKEVLTRVREDPDGRHRQAIQALNRAGYPWLVQPAIDVERLKRLGRETVKEGRDRLQSPADRYVTIKEVTHLRLRDPNDPKKGRKARNG